MTATTDTVTIVCPAWCDRTDLHLAELDDWDGYCVHTGYFSDDVAVGVTLAPDGTLPADGSHGFTLLLGGHDTTVEEAEAQLEVLAAAISAAKATRTELGL